MNKFAMTALAFSTLGASASATTGNDWLELDREINALTSPSLFQQGGINVTALIRVYGTYGDDDAQTGGGSDITGFELDDVDIAVSGEVGDFGWRINVDADSGVAVLEDAYAWWQFSDYVSARLGQFKPQVFFSNLVDPENQVMIDRTLLGSAFDFWDLGAGANGQYEMIDWMVNVFNGADADGNDSRYTFRVEYDLGQGVGEYEGAYGAGDDLNATVGGVYVHDDSISGDASLFGVDFNGTFGQIGFGAEIADVDDDFGMTTAGDFGNYFGGPLGGVQPFLAGDSTPFALTGSFMLNEEFEVALRFQDVDDADDRRLLTAGVNWFQSGHNAKWQANITDVSADTDANEGTFLQVGLVLGSTR
ncbi:MAG: porin [Planctomycetota bacterium]